MRYYRIFISIFCLLLFAIAMATKEEAAKVYIVYLEKKDGVSPEALEASHLQTLSSVLGSDEAARSALLYSYKNVVNGFSAKLTPSQAEALTGKPGVLQVVPSQTLHLQGGAVAPQS